MSDELTKYTSSALVSASVLSDKSPPSWLAAAIIELKLWKTRGLLSQLQEIPWLRPAKRYVLCDLVLVLLACAVSGISSLREFYREMWPWQDSLAAIWGRKCLPSRSRIVEMPYFVTQEHLDALQTLFLNDAANHWPQHSLGGLRTHQGECRLIFDLDPTRMTVLERGLGETEERPGGQRRAREATAPGYTGRKRGDRVRTRTVVHSPHSGMWVLTFGHPGNPNHLDTLNRSGEAIKALCTQLEVSLSEVVVRMDGEWGHLKHLVVLKQKGFGYLARVGDYSVLRLAQVQAVLERGSSVLLQLPDSSVEREVFDVPNCHWQKGLAKPSLETRFVITRRKARQDGKKERVGHKRGEWVYEIITTDQSPKVLSAAEVVTLYLGRGSFEGVLGQEDAEIKTDDWRSFSPQGEDLWQILCQWVWNHRVQLGSLIVPEESPAERVLKFEAVTTAHQGMPVDLEWEEAKKMDDLQRWLEEKKETELWQERPSGNEGVFTCNPEGFVHCPLGFKMRLVEKRERVSGLRHRYEMTAAKCETCPLKGDCRGKRSSKLTGRKIDVLAELIAFSQKEGLTIKVLSIPLTDKSDLALYQSICEVSLSGTLEHEKRQEEKEQLSQKNVVEMEEVEVKKKNERTEEAPEESEQSPQEQVLEARPLEGADVEEVMQEKVPVLLWYDIAASACRGQFTEQVRGEQVKVSYEEVDRGEQVKESYVEGAKDRELGLESQLKLETQDERAHRRRTWKEKLALNNRPTDALKLSIEVTGIPPKLAEAAGLHVIPLPIPTYTPKAGDIAHLHENTTNPP